MRVTIIGRPFTPIHELGMELARYYDLDFITLENSDAPATGYFDDKIDEVRFDTGDMTSGSGSQQYVRDPMAEEKQKAIKEYNIPETSQADFTQEEKDQISFVEVGILSTEVPDYCLINWSDIIIFLESPAKEAKEWLSNRRRCPTCLSTFHLKDSPPKVSGCCDRCGTDLIRQECDTPKNVRLLYENWERIFRKFLLEVKKSNKLGVISVTKSKDFEDIVNKAQRILKSNGIRTRNSWYY